MIEKDREKYILNNLKLVKYIASKYYTDNFGIDFDDLVSYGNMGLIDAANKYDETRNCKFSTYASLKIRSYIIDEIRRNSPISRNSMANINKYNSAVKELQVSLLREPNEREISKYLKIPLDDVRKIESDIYSMTITSLDTVIFQGNNDISLMDTIKDTEEMSPTNIVEESEKIEILTKAIDMLKEKDKLVLSLYYYEELSLKEIGKVLEVSESRVCQIHSRAIVNLRNVIKKLNYNIA
ncbi:MULTISPECIES: sigma-70 family RNA polymerase sigma factor [Clostridium]|uniref:RNA polymerase sigma factor n=1 Tax=Clostridium cadaveris TaxID=1529 RepID=A0A1I2LXC4_9CLOT|nr:FliA/WhiG family RNA polymerase sigma factor [Clostridium cadaveris]MDU4953961.1 FliA/WhiG family RNA polymerase sigma factor [Clostridium sp.]MDM8312347.1 FliA/WhiG family RNA polymerase sigma factor [Clostridium cadaveris]MDY4948505.1 FliA/WhiG family RNA polymerase sigma factor [Clostridium cadaveris]NME63759.1 FliA/WhiG family RNA polymerase sigma factor [Clostridium cadaveris]SFF83208.1 RNA polymerase, sigma 28 subunit, SigD/FliA/WhiG [Clostridium cadaveris]